MNQDLPRATVAFVPREQFSTTQRSLETLYDRTSEPFELICVDGGSPAKIRDYLATAAREKGFTLLRSEEYLTPNQSRNLALKHVRTPYVVFVDNDVLVSHHWLSALTRCADETGAWVVAPLYFEFEPEGNRIHMFGGDVEIKTLPDGRRDYYERHHLAHQLIRDVDANLKRTETDLIEFHTVLISMQAFDLLGPLDEGIQCNSEHGDLCLSVRNAGGKIYLEPESRITYVPPKGLSGADREFFLLRWSRARHEAGCRHLCEKWSVDPDSDGMKACSNWCDQHRRYALGFLPKLKRIIGRKLGSRVEKRVVARWEAWQNRRQFPPHIYGQLLNPSVTLVHQPDPAVWQSGSEAA